MRGVVGLTLDYRDPERTERCVLNLLQEGAKHVLVWDNSDDGGKSAGVILRKFSGSPQVSVIDAEANLGFSAGVNRGFEWLVGRFPGDSILLINNDAHLLPGALQVLSESLEGATRAILVFPDIDHGGWVRGVVHYHRLTGMISDHPLPGSFAYASGCCLLIRPEICEGKLMDEDFFMYGEDWELGWRLSRRPGSMVHVPQLLVSHEGSASSQMGSPFYEARVVAAQLIIARKLAEGDFDGWVVARMHDAWLLLRAVVRTLRFRNMVPMRALREGRKIAADT